MKSQSVTIQIKAIKQFFPVVLFIFIKGFSIRVSEEF